VIAARNARQWSSPAAVSAASPCALALGAAQLPGIVLEQSARSSRIGAGIQLAPNAWHAIDALGRRRAGEEAGRVHRAPADVWTASAARR